MEERLLGTSRPARVAARSGHDDLEPRHRRARGCRAAPGLRRRRRDPAGHGRVVRRRRFRGAARQPSQYCGRARRGAAVHQGGSSADGARRRRRRFARSAAGLARRVAAAPGTDHVDLWLVQAPDPRTPLEETVSALRLAVTSGRARYVGLSNHPGWQTARAASLLEPDPGLAAVEVEYSLLERGIEREVVPAAAALGIGVLAWSPLGRGVLTGKYRHGTPADSRAASPHFAAFVEPYLGAGSSQIVAAVTIAAQGRALAARGRARLGAGPASGDVRHRRGPHRGSASRRPGKRGPRAAGGILDAPSTRSVRPTWVTQNVDSRAAPPVVPDRPPAGDHPTESAPRTLVAGFTGLVIVNAATVDGSRHRVVDVRVSRSRRTGRRRRSRPFRRRPRHHRRRSRPRRGRRAALTVDPASASSYTSTRRQVTSCVIDGGVTSRRGGWRRRRSEPRAQRGVDRARRAGRRSCPDGTARVGTMAHSVDGNIHLGGR